jgi:hypothetical protein
MLSTFGSYPTRGAHISQKSTSHLKILTAMAGSKFHIEDPQVLGTTIQKFSCLGDLVPEICATLVHTVVKIRTVTFWVMTSYSSNFIADGALIL